jgi:hypothetical protein
MTCKHCGYRVSPNPLKFLIAALGQGCMLIFLDHMTPSPDSALGAQNFYINWHWLMWWGTAAFGVFSLVIFMLASGAWMNDPAGYYRPRKEAH